MRKFKLLIFCLLLISTNSLAQTNNFGLNQIDFFKNEISENVTADELFNQTHNDNDQIENLWVEPIIQQDGSTAQYTPPKEVKDFLEDPNEETGKVYLQWSMKRLDKLAKAENILRKLTTDTGSLTYNRSPLYPYNTVKSDIRYIAFFLLKDCPYCEQQKTIIKDVLTNRPDIKVDVFVRGYTEKDIRQLPFGTKHDNDLSKSLGFSKFPTTLIVDDKGNRSLVGGVLSEQFTYNILSKKSDK